MDNNDQVIQTIYEAIEELNHNLGPHQILEKSPDTVLNGNGKLDSLQFLNLTLAVEVNIERMFRKSISVTEVALLGDEREPLTVAILADRISNQLNVMAHA